MNHWAEKYIGLQWSPLGNGIDSFNCWTFVQHIQKEKYHRELPEILTDGAANLAVMRACAVESGMDHWEPVEVPTEGDCVLLARATHPAHVGIWINANGSSGVLHCAKGPGVIFQTPANLRNSGWGSLSFYRWKL